MFRYILLLGRVLVLAIMGALALPGIILNLPVGFAARTLANRHAKQALAASNVKVSGRDVIASYKILVSMVMWPLIHLFYASWVVHNYGWAWGVSLFSSPCSVPSIDILDIFLVCAISAIRVSCTNNLQCKLN